jgi:hypothetical protein
MARTRTLTNLISDVRTQSNTQGVTVRHTDADITRALNQEIQRHRREVSQDGITNYLTHYSSTMTAGATSPHVFGVLDLSTGPSPALVRLYGLDITVSGYAKTLHAVSFSERSDYGSQADTPEAWAPMTTYKFAILPAPAQAYTYVAHYLPLLADLSTGSDTFDGIEGYEDVVVYGACVRLCARDQYPNAYSMFKAEYAEAKASVLATARQTGKGVVHRRRDTWGERRRDLRDRRAPWRW